MGFFAEHVDQTDCPQCGRCIDVAAAKTFSKITCSCCRAEVTVPARAGTMLITRLLGQGTSSLVYEAHDRVLGRTVALKVMKAEATGEGGEQAGLDEARALLMIDHPNVVKVHAIDTRRGQPCIIMEPLPGGSLKEKIAGGRTIDEKCALSIAIDISRGLREAHRHGLLHLDVKPGNIMFDAAGAAKILDFGFAGIDLDASSDDIIGTPYYVSPELVRHETPDLRADIYSLGATLFHILTGSPPFHDPSVRKLTLDRLERPAPDIRTIKPDLSEATADVVARMLEQSPDDRYADYEQLLRDLMIAKDPSAVALEPVVPTPVVYPKPRKRRIQTSLDARQAAREWMQHMGLTDAALVLDRADNRVDIRAERAVARIMVQRKPVGRPEVRQLRETADAEGREPIFFAMAGYTREAVAEAKEKDVALFALNRVARLFAENESARQVLEKNDRPR